MRYSRIAVLCTPDTQLGTTAPFRDLEHLSQRFAAELDEGGKFPSLEMRSIYDASLPSAPLVSSQPLRLGNQHSGYDVIVLPARYDPPDDAPDVDERTATWLQAQHREGSWICGIGAGVLTLAGAGLLDDGVAAVPPRFAARVRKRYPGIKLAHASAIAEHNRVLTAAEPSLVFELAVMVARRIHSHGLAERYRRACSVRERTDESLFPELGNRDILISEARAWIVAHMHEDIDAERIAAQFHVSARTLARRFEQASGISPSRFLRLVRMDAAVSMLERTRFSVEQIAHLVGYRDTGCFRDVFRQHTGQTPREFRMGRARGKISVAAG